MLAVLVVIIGIVLVGILGVRSLLAPPAAPPAFTDARPAVSDDPNSYVTQTEEIIIDLPIDQYNAWSNSVELEAILPGGSGIPSVVRTEMIKGTWNNVGARRRVVLEDGHYTAEEVIANEQPELFRYQVWNYTNFARFAVDYAIGEFRLEDLGDQTRVIWTYSYHKNSILSDLFLPSFVHNDWGAYMRTVLQTMKRESENASRS
jgi:hypothetical protein